MDLYHLAEAVFFRLFHCKVPLPLPPPSYCRLQKSLYTATIIFFYTYIRSCFLLTNFDLLEAFIFMGPYFI